PQVAGACTPAHLAAEPALGLVGDPHPMPAGVLAEPLDPGLVGGLSGLRACVGREIGVGQRAHDQDLVTVELHLGRRLEPLPGESSDEPTLEMLLEIALFAHAWM